MSPAKDPNDPITIKVKYTNLVARTESLLKSARHYCAIFRPGVPENNYDLTESLPGYEKEAFRIAIDVMNKQIKNPVLRITYKNLDDATMSYIDAWNQTYSEAYRTPEGRKLIDEKINACDIEYGKAVSKVKQLITESVTKRLLSKKSDVNLKLNYFQEDINEQLTKISSFYKNDLKRTRLDVNDNEVPCLLEAEQYKMQQELKSLYASCKSQLDHISIAKQEMSYSDKEQILYDAENGIIKALHYRFSRSKKQRDPGLEEAINPKPKTKPKTVDDEMNDLIKQLNELAKQKNANKQKPASGKPAPLGTPNKKKK